MTKKCLFIKVCKNARKCVKCDIQIKVFLIGVKYKEVIDGSTSLASKLKNEYKIMLLKNLYANTKTSELTNAIEEDLKKKASTVHCLRMTHAT